MWRKVIMLVTVVSLTACSSWVKLTPEGEKVRVLSAEEVKKCKLKGHTTVSVLGKIGNSNRRPEVIQDELNRAARNSASDMKGDTVAPVSAITDGKQKFGIYRCMPE